MKISKTLAVVALFFIMADASAQTDASKGTGKGSVILTDSTVVSGMFKEKIRSNASVTLIGDKKKTYDGSDLIGAEIGDEKYICIKGDFFKIISDGKLKFLQKSSDASSKPVHTGNETVFSNGTPGVPGDYFIYNNISKQLKLVNRKSVSSVAEESFAGCDEAITKAKSVNGDIAKLNEAVDIYNSRNKN